MENQSISAHIVVINSSGAKPAETKANSALEGAPSQDFANLLAAQIQGERPGAEVVGTIKLDPALLDEQDKNGKDAAISSLVDSSALPDNHLIQNINLLSLGQPQRTQTELDSDSGKSEAVTLETALGKVAAKDVTGLEKAAIEAAGTARFAATDKSLPLDIARDLKSDTNNPSSLSPGSLTQLNRTSTVPAASPIPTAAATVAVPVGNAGWDTAFSQRVVWVASNTQQIAQLHLNPPNLGPLEVRINLTSEHANAAFTSPHAAVREAIEAALPRLREMLADNGLSLGNVNVSSESFQQQAQSGQSDPQRHDPFRELQRLVAAPSSAGSLTQGVAHIAAGDRGLVDIFA